MFVVVDGTPSVLLRDPPTLHEAPRGTLVVVEPGTLLRWQTDGDRDALVFAYGVPAGSRPELLEP